MSSSSGDKAQFQSLASTGSFAGRVGHKAGGFISKKFFHPSSFKNQEKLWAAIESKKEQEKRQEELMKKRDEERRVQLVKQNESFVPSTQNTASSGIFTGASSSSETKRRLELLNLEERAERMTHNISVKSRYPEDVLEHGHSQVWGSFFDLSSKTWGYACCKGLVRSEPCVKRQRRNDNLP